MPESAAMASGLPAIHGGLPQATIAGNLLFVPAMYGISPATGRLVMTYSDLDDETGRSLGTGLMAIDDWAETIQSQCWQLFQNISSILAANAAEFDDILRINMWITDFSLLPVLAPVRSKVFAPSTPPPITNIGTREMPVPGALIQAEIVAALPSRDVRRIPIEGPSVSQFVGHYGLASRAGDVVFAAGMIAANNDARQAVLFEGDLPDSLASEAAELLSDSPASRAIESRTTAQTVFILRDLEAALRDNDLTLDDVAHVSVYPKEPLDLLMWERVARRVFGPALPPITVMPCTGLGMEGFRLETEVVAGASAGVAERVWDGEHQPVVAGSAALSTVGNFAFVAGFYGIDAENGNPLAASDALTRLQDGGVGAQTTTAMTHLAETLARHGLSMRNLAALNVTVLQPASVLRAREAIIAALPEDAVPACSFVVVPWLPLREALVQIEATVER